ncbi:MAG TPA: CBS domain-containing protein [Bacteroidetes bacterium]|nr:CBS domain-containing protein [Bacteroidota bacterium]
MLNEEVRKIMTKDPVVVHPDDTVGHVMQVMLDEKLQQIPVVEDLKLVGLITSYDIRQDPSLNGDSQKKVREVMNEKVIFVKPKDKVGTAAELFVGRRFKTLPVVNLRHELKGVVTTYDVLKHVMQKEYPVPILYKEILQN